jgi:formylglycine-generating enzyme required for sulfatase activity
VNPKPPTANKLGMTMIAIDPGSFTMGSQIESDSPQHPVRITKPFHIGRCEVTQAQFEKLMGSNPSFFQKENRPKPNALAASEKDDSFFTNPAQAEKPEFYADLPVENVSWNEAVEFCRKLSALEGRRYRLPTEAEWEYACRAGTHGVYYWGERMDEEYCHFATIFPIRVGRRKPNAWGLYDMLGNVFEWCSDWHAKYDGGEQVDPTGPKDGKTKVYRGGSFDIDIDLNLRCAVRFGLEPDKRLKDLGFRVVLEE